MLSGLFEARKIGGQAAPAAVPTMLATLLAFVVGYASIAWLLRYLVRHSLAVFVVYRVALGTLVLALTASGPSCNLLRTMAVRERVRLAPRSSTSRSRRCATATTPTRTSTSPRRAGGATTTTRAC